MAGERQHRRDADGRARFGGSPQTQRRGTTRADKSARKAPDGLRRDFSPPSRPDVRWCGDLTEIPTDEGKLQLAAVLDLHSRRCIGFAMGIHHDAELARAALCVAIAVRGGVVAGVLFHTDQGSEYTANFFTDACGSAGVTQSMGRTGSALDNAVSESFNSTLELELLRHRHFCHPRASPPGSRTVDRRIQQPSDGIPPMGCSARPITNAHAQPTAPPRNPAGGGRHEPSGGGFAAAIASRSAPRKATGPSLRPQGSLPRSLRDGPTVRP